jgi:hypothetical protein
VLYELPELAKSPAGAYKSSTERRMVHARQDLEKLERPDLSAEQ